MKKAPIPKNDLERLKALNNYNVLDTESEDAFDEITKLASLVCDTKIALVSLVDKDRQWFKSKFGLDAAETPRDISYCGHAIMSDEVFIVENAEFDERFCDNPLFLNEPHVRFYAGAPLITPAGFRVGTLCVIDDKEKSLSENQKEVLKSLAKNVVNLLELKFKTEELKSSRTYLELALEGANLGIWDWNLKDNSVSFDRRWAEMLGLSINDIEMNLSTWEERVHPDDLESCYADIKRYMDGECDQYENIHRMKHANGSWVYILDKGRFSEFDKEGEPIRFTGTHLDVTDLKTFEEEQKIILSHTNVGIWKWNVKENDLSWDESMYKLYQIDRDDFTGDYEAWESTLHPDYKQASIEEVNKALNDPSVHEFEYTWTIMTQLGESRYIGTRAKVSRDNKGEAVYIYGINWDKTEEYAKSLEVNNYLDSMNSIALVSKTDTYGRITYANEKFQEVSQYSEEELLGQDHRIINSGYHSKEFFKEMWDNLKNGRPWRGEVRNKAKDGSYYWVDTTITPTVNEYGNILEFISIRYDITKQKSQELEQRRLADERAVLNKLLELKPSQSDKVDVVLEEALNIVMEVSWLKLLNKAGVFLVEDDILRLQVSHNLGEIIEGMCKEVVKGRCLCGRAFSSGEVIHADCVDERHENRFDGIAPHGHYNVPILLNEDVIGVIVFYLEHGHKKSEDEISFLKSCSEVFSRIIANYNYEKEIIKSRDEALAAERAKSLFLANMSHEIRTPMNGIIGMLELLGETTLNEDQKEMLSTSESCSQTLLSILNDILDLSKIESGKLALDPIRFNLKECVEQAIHLLSFTASQKYIDIDLEWNIKSGDWFIGDITRIRQVLINLLSNAIKFTEKGRVIVTVASKNGGKLEDISISVADTGIGISKSIQEKLFSDFTQADETTTRKFGGTGLGLAICKRLVHLMKGSITLESEEGVGSTFHVNISLERVSEYVRDKKQQSFDTLSMSEHRILLVEDNKMNQKIAVMMLKKLGLKCDIANNGLEGYEAAKKGDYSLVFMDMQMPIMDGIESTKKIISDMGESAPTIVAMTANAFADDKEKCFESGMSDFIAKPIKVSELKRVLFKK